MKRSVEDQLQTVVQYSNHAAARSIPKILRCHVFLHDSTDIEMRHKDFLFLYDLYVFFLQIAPVFLTMEKEVLARMRQIIGWQVIILYHIFNF
jgi:hypothetical protein